MSSTLPVSTECAISGKGWTNRSLKYSGLGAKSQPSSEPPLSRQVCSSAAYCSLFCSYSRSACWYCTWPWASSSALSGRTEMPTLS